MLQSRAYRASVNACLTVQQRTARILQPRLQLLACGALLLAGCLYAIAFCASATDVSGHARGSDDAYISYRYAQNLVHGRGLVYNPGERVEGYSNLLYVLLMALPAWRGWDIYAFSVALNSVFACAALAVFMRFMARSLGERAALPAGVLFALSPSLWIWVSSGLESPLVFLLQVGIWVLVEDAEAEGRRRDRLWLCAATALLALTRADGFVLPVLAIAYLAWRGKRRTALAVGATLAATLACLFAWRLAYYHDLWPNTYYAKVAGTLPTRLRAAIRELGGIAARQQMLVALVIVGWRTLHLGLAAARALRPALQAVRCDLFLSLGWLAYWLYVGGDIFEDRFLLILIPTSLSILSRAVTVSSLGPARNVVLLLALFAQLAVPIRSEQYGKTAAPKHDRWIALGKFLAAGPPDRVLATDAAGKLPFFSGLPTIDMLGLNDRYIAHLPAREYTPGSAWVGHSKYDPDYVLARAPDLIATWLAGDALDLACGLTRAKYLAAGYRLRYVVNTTPRSRYGGDILEVGDQEDEAIISLVRWGYGYAVLERSAGAR
jgi:arabinofuranosyltransferase